MFTKPLSSIIFLTTCLFFSCSKEEVANDIFDQWEIIEASGTLAEENIGTTYTFTKDGSVTISGGGLSNSGTFEHDGSILTIILSGIGFIYKYVLEEDMLSMESTTSRSNFYSSKKIISSIHLHKFLTHLA